MKFWGLAVVTLMMFLEVLQTGALMAKESDEIAAAINAHLKRFAEHPSEVMNEAPERWDELNRPVEPGTDFRFSISAIQSGDALKAKDTSRAQMCMEANGKVNCLGSDVAVPRTAIRGNDRPEDLVDGQAVIRSIKELDLKGLRSATLSVSPWSGDYWALYKGMLGARYADPNFPVNRPGTVGKDWYENHSYVRKHSASEIIRSKDDAQIDLLSPSEKYDMLVGDSGLHLTSNMWNTGKERYDAIGKVETWSGICDGWASAAMMLPRPQKTLKILAADGKTWLQFYPSDAKALASLLWARGNPSLRFIGGRCDVKNPSTDDNGRITSKDCFDTNPGTWHVAVTNQIGIAHRGFLLDATYDYEVWNQPALSYHYWYFNPQTWKHVDTLEAASVPIDQFTEDKFDQYRSSKAVSVVGIVMDFTYVSEKRPHHDPSDSPDKDSRRTVRYYYDLELDASGNIVGGEWYNNRHPDFLWLPEPGSHVGSVAEGEAKGRWGGPSEVIPDSWRNAALHASKMGQPLGKIVERIFSWAQEASSLNP
jgi:hypothetical protein